MAKGGWCAAILIGITGINCSAGGDGESGFVPGRDLPLAELAGAPRPIEYVAVQTQARPSAFHRIVADAQRGTLAAAEADVLILKLMLGRSPELPDGYLADEASLAVPDFEPYAIRMRWGSYEPEEQAEILALLDELDAEPTVALAPLQRLFGPDIAYAAPATAQSLVEVVTQVPSEAARLDEAASVAAAAWPGISSFMGISFPELNDFEIGDEVRLKQPLTENGQLAVDQGVDPGATGTIESSIFNSWSIAFGNTFVELPAADIDLVNPARKPIRIELVASSSTPAGQPLDENVGGIFKGCRNIFVRSDDAGQCTLAGRVVHELFHCAQSVRSRAEYGYQTPDADLAAMRARWVIEGTAMWAMDEFGPDNNHEWKFMEVYGFLKTFQPLDQLMHWSGLYFNFVEAEFGGRDAVRHLFDVLENDPNRTQLGIAFQDDPANWHRFVHSSTGYPALTSGSAGRALVDGGGGPLPFEPATGCVDDGPAQIGQEYLADLQEISSSKAPVFDFELPGPAAQHHTLEVVDVAEIQYLDVGLFGEIGDLARDGDPEIRITALLETAGGGEVVQDWTAAWRTPTGPRLEIRDFEGQDLEADASVRICMTSDAPCQDVAETFPDLERIRLVVSWAGIRSSAEDKLGGQLAIVPGSIDGWTGSHYRRGTPEEAHDEEDSQ